ncbi:PAS domain-containing sensor histidine kinase [Paenibacillus sambharensis]|uniref:histidine kinase n=1 Tax=Paenibacillus sambharensis TaxID=1803190 RepID=A0A2W1L8Y9_9BACL|nr:ATP-binding protein [Paenibacillus sambharensis]PZD94600.1 PAS domain-containing sensor histidine kinase [Paenibacillus sambharensis]
MQAIRKRYFPALAEYIRNGNEASLYEATELGKMLHGIHPEEIVALHEETMQTLVSNVESEEALELYNRSFIFLIELMVAYRFRVQPDEPEDKRYSDMREMLFRSHLSFQSVKSKYENVLQHMDSGIALFDSEGLLSFINLQMAKILDIPRKMLLGCSLKEILYHPQLRKSVKRMIVRVCKEMMLQRSRYYEIQDSAGRHLLITITYGDQLDGDYLISVKDVSEYKQIEQTAYQNDKLAMLGKIAAAIAHEIRNPLTSIRGFIQLLRPHLMQLGKEEYARIILAEIDRANDIIYEFLNSSKPSAPMAQEVRIAALLKEVILLSESEALMRGCQLQFETCDESLCVSIDVKQIKQVILNLVKNAMDAIGELNGERPGLIAIKTQRNEQFVEISIRDNGRGMDRLTMNKLFDPFFTTKEAGTGLGLSVSYRIIRNHGGTIRVDSNLGEGTEFNIYLPLVL